MQKVEGSSPFIRFTELAGNGGFLVSREATGGPWTSAGLAFGRRSDGDGRRTRQDQRLSRCLLPSGMTRSQLPGASLRTANDHIPRRASPVSELRDLLAPALVAEIERLVDERIEATLAAHTENGSADPWLGLAEAAEYARVSRRTLSRLIGRGRVRSTCLGRRRLVHRGDLDLYLNDHLRWEENDDDA
jgi:excisionase family DNA binding protein